jgi:small nuclear ribonucleoprotein (snRNP)-like protein
MAALAARRFTEEFASLLDKPVAVYMVNGRRLTGRVTAYNSTDYSVWLAEVTTEDGRSIPRLFIPGRSLAAIEIVEAGPDLTPLLERINVVFPNMARYVKEAGVIVVMDRIRVTKDGVVEGTGPAAERIQRLWEEWRREVSTG